MPGLDFYCERAAPEFWAEPVNAVTNAAFLIAAVMAYRGARRGGPVTLPVSILIGLVAAIGVGSFLFHTLATPWAMAADVVPITLFQIVFLFCYSRYVAGLSPYRALMIVLGLLMLARSLEFYGWPINEAIIDGLVVFMAVIFLGALVSLGLKRDFFQEARRLTDNRPTSSYSVPQAWYAAMNLKFSFEFLCAVVRTVRQEIPVSIWLGLMAAFLGIYILAQTTDFEGETFNGSLAYGASLIFLIGFAVYHAQTKKQARYGLGIAAAVFSISLILRTVDPVVCPLFPLGTHFIWHVLNAVVLYLLVITYHKNQKI